MFWQKPTMSWIFDLIMHVILIVEGYLSVPPGPLAVIPVKTGIQWLRQASSGRMGNSIAHAGREGIVIRE